MGCCRKTSPEEGDQPETQRPSGKFFFCFISVRKNYCKGLCEIVTLSHTKNHMGKNEFKAKTICQGELGI